MNLFLLHEEDNVLICCQQIKAGEVSSIDGNAITLFTDINVGHKIARLDLKPDDKIIKYGVYIGSTTAAIKKGEHVHLHNMKSDYIEPHIRN